MEVNVLSVMSYGTSLVLSLLALQLIIKTSLLFIKEQSQSRMHLISSFHLNSHKKERKSFRILELIEFQQLLGLSQKSLIQKLENFKKETFGWLGKRIL